MKKLSSSILLALSIVGIVGIAGCSGKQIRQDQKDNYSLQLNAFTQQQAAFNSLAAVALETCKVDANPGLCVSSALSQFQRGTGNVPQAPRPYVSNSGRTVSAILGTVNTGLNIWGGLLQGNNYEDLVRAVGETAGNHVNGDFINGWQDNSDNSNHSVDNSTAVAGNFGDTYGNDFTGGDRTQNDFSGAGPVVVDSTDTTVGDQNDNQGNIGQDNRQGSNGPFDDNSDPGNDCTGDNCQGVPPVEPLPPGF